MTMVAGEVGKTLRINTKYDLSAQTAMSLEIKRPNGQTTTINSGITVGQVDVTVDGETLNANEYVQYVTDADTFPDAGLHQLKLSVTFASKALKTIYKEIEVEA